MDNLSTKLGALSSTEDKDSKHGDFLAKEPRGRRHSAAAGQHPCPSEFARAVEEVLMGEVNGAATGEGRSIRGQLSSQAEGRSPRYAPRGKSAPPRNLSKISRESELNGPSNNDSCHVWSRGTIGKSDPTIAIEGNDPPAGSQAEFHVANGFHLTGMRSM